LAVGAAGASIFPQLGLRPRATLLLAHGRAQPTNNTLPALQQFGQWELGSMAAHQTKCLLPDSGLCGAVLQANDWASNPELL
jgi:hypothetical protein